MDEPIDRSRCELVNLRGVPIPEDARELSLARSLALTSLAGLHAPSLEKLTLNGCTSLASLEGIEGAPRLRELHARGCTALSELDPLAGVPLLETLDVAKTSVADVRPLARLPLLDQIDLSSCGAIDLTPLVDAPALRVIALESATIRTRDVPRVLRSRCAWTRREIDAARSRAIPMVQIEDLAPTEHTAALRRLFTAGGASLPQARELTRSLGPRAYAPLFSGASYRATGGRHVLRSPQIDEASLLALIADAPMECEPATRFREGIERLDLTSDLDVDDLAALPKLRELHVRNASVRGTRRVTLASLRFLRLDRARASELAWLPELPAIERLLVFDTPIARLDGIERATGLRELVLFRAGPIRTLAPLAACTSLTYFCAYQTGLPDLRALIELPALRTVSIRSAGALDLAPLRERGIEILA